MRQEEIAKQLSLFVNAAKFIKTPQLKALLKMSHRTIGVFTGNQAGKCIKFQTLIDTPDGKVTVGSLFENKKPFDVWAWDGHKKVVAKADAPFKKHGLHKCSRIEMSDGQVIEAADKHRILTILGKYEYVEDMVYSFSTPLTLGGSHIVRITEIGEYEVYDFGVEKYHNYLAGGLVHHNTSGVAYQYFLRVLGLHPVPEKNLLAKKIRCMSSSLPESTNENEQDNTQYLELKKLIPPQMIVSDITARSQNLVVRRFPNLNSEKTVFEFRSSKQEVQDLGKIQLSSVWHDEETPKPHREECKMRLLAEGGDEIFSLTPINYLSYTFDEIWQRKSYLWKSETIRNMFGGEIEEVHSGDANIGCLQFATDDNPTLDPSDIDLIFMDITDPDILALRRYGVFKQVSGRIHKAYDPSICYISFSKHFPDGIPGGWVHTRGIDYHESRTPWSIGWLSCSPQNEWFLWNEFHPAIDGVNAYNTYEISKGILRRSEDYLYTVNLIDPLANKKQPNTLFSATDDLNRHFDEIRRNDGIGTPAYWQGWDTHGTTGRNEVGMRFKNASRCGVPFNNKVIDKGRVTYLPTLWICDTCPKFNQSLINWRYGEWVTTSTKMVNDAKQTPQQKFSHDCMVLECLAKDHRVTHASHFMSHRPSQIERRATSVTGR